MLIKHNIIRHSKTSNARLCTIRSNTPHCTPTLIGNIDIPLGANRRANRSRNTRGQQLQAFTIQAQAIYLACWTIRHDNRIRDRIPPNAIYSMLTLRTARRSRYRA